MKPPKVQNMRSKNGNLVPNQFEIFTDEGVYFQSYSTLIAFKPYGGKVTLDKNAWNCSQTTTRYRSIFLRETPKETKRKINSGEYLLTDLN